MKKINWKKTNWYKIQFDKTSAKLAEVQKELENQKKIASLSPSQIDCVLESVPEMKASIPNCKIFVFPMLDSVRVTEETMPSRKLTTYELVEILRLIEPLKHETLRNKLVQMHQELTAKERGWENA